MTTHKNNPQHQKAFRDKKLANGLSEVRGIFAPKLLHQAIRDAAKVLVNSANHRSDV